MPSRLRGCAISHGVDAALAVRVPVIARRVSPAGLAAHVSIAALAWVLLFLLVPETLANLRKRPFHDPDH
jgi:hypothetical protein